MGAIRVRPPGRSRLHGYERIHGRKEPGTDKIRIPRPTLDRGRPDRVRRRIVLSRRRHTLPEPAQFRALHRTTDRGRAADLSRPDTYASRASYSGAGPPVQAWPRQRGLLPGEI